MPIFSGVSWCEILSPEEVCQVYRTILDEVRRERPVMVRFNSLSDKVKRLEYDFDIPGVGFGRLIVKKDNLFKRNYGLDGYMCVHELDRCSGRRFCVVCGMKLLEDDYGQWDLCDIDPPVYSAVAPELERLQLMNAICM